MIFTYYQEVLLRQLNTLSEGLDSVSS